MAQKFANAARAALSAGIASGDTTITIGSGGSLFPEVVSPDFARAVLQDGSGIEIVLITAHAAGANSFTVTRAQEGTTARSFDAGSVFGVRMTAADGDDFAAKVSGPSSATNNAVALFDGTTGKAVKDSTLTFDGTNLTNSGAYTAPSSLTGAGTTTTIIGSTGTGQAGASGGNGLVEIIGGGGTSNWTSFVGFGGRRRGGINIQAGTAAADASATYVNGSSIQIRGSNGTNNGTTAGQGSSIALLSGNTTKTDTFISAGASFSLNGASTASGGSVSFGSGSFGYASGLANSGSSITLGAGSSSAGGTLSLSGGAYNTDTAYNNGATIEVLSASATTGGNIRLRPGLAGIAGSTLGKVVVANPNTGTDYDILTTASTVEVANGGTGATYLAANNVILGNGTSAVQEVAPGTSGNVLTSNGTTWTSAALPAGGLTYIFTTTHVTATDKQGVLTSTAGGSFTVTLPATPSVGAQVVVADAGNNWGTNNLTVGRNGSTINGLAEDLTCDITGASVQFVYDGTTWEVYAQIGGQGGTVVTLDSVQTLTNKTMDYNDNTFTNFPAATPFSNNTSLAQVQATALCF